MSPWPYLNRDALLMRVVRRLYRLGTPDSLEAVDAFTGLSRYELDVLARQEAAAVAQAPMEAVACPG